MIFRSLWFLAVLLLSAHATANDPAGNPEKAADTILLEVSGNITNFTSRDDEGYPIVQFDLAMLEQLATSSFDTRTPWTDGDTHFEGVRISDLLEFVGAQSNDFTVSALDEYSIRIDDTDFSQYPILVAYKLNGEYMSVRDLGPLWLMYPFDDYPELISEESKAKCVWQLIRIEVH